VPYRNVNPAHRRSMGIERPRHGIEFSALRSLGTRSQSSFDKLRRESFVTPANVNRTFKLSQIQE
jgi:hypothetical protein